MQRRREASLTVCNGATPEGFDTVRYKVVATHELGEVKFHAKWLCFTQVECRLTREILTDWIWSSRVNGQPKVLARNLTFRVSSNQAAAKLLVVTLSKAQTGHPPLCGAAIRLEPLKSQS
jgi:hypothetical protein